VSVVRPARVEVLLGYLKEEVAKEHLPNTFKYFEAMVFNKNDLETTIISS